ncbi:MAG: VacJ family lipoprotein [Alphaproteobacteria bacterium]|nr:VacJ family lipoprotein [Alphaproteobacteria bacterium]
MARGRGIRAFARFALLAVAVALAGCASGPRGADQVAGYADEDVNDPLEGLNRQIFAINSAADALILRPISVLYSEVVFTPVQNIVRSLLNYLTLPLTFINDMLQGEWDRAGDTATRFVINTMVLGLGDLAADFGRPEQHSEDFGQTLAVWGIRDGGPYLVLPFIGPSNIRDAVGFGVDVYTDPVGNVLTTGQSLARAGMAGVDFRVRNGHEIDELERSSIDYYATVRSLYRQKRASDIRNGAPDKLTPGPGIGDTGQPVASLTAHNPEAPLTY